MNRVPPPPERRAHKRFSVRTPLLYRPAGSAIRSGWQRAATLDMSAGGIRIQTVEALAVGTTWELAMDWTGLYHGRERMRLHLIGAVIRTGGRGVVLRILTHRFREATVFPQTVTKKLAVA